MKQLALRFINGVFLGIGFSIGGLIVVVILLIIFKDLLPDSIINNNAMQYFYSDNNNSSSNFDITHYQAIKKVSNPLIDYIHGSGQINVPDKYLRFTVKNVDAFYKIQQEINKHKGNAAIYFANGKYHFNKTIMVKQPNIMMLSLSGNPKDVILQGNGMHPTNRVNSLFEVHTEGFVIDGLTLENVGNHLIQIKAEKQASFPIIRNSILQNSYEQMIKVSYDKINTPDNYSDSGLVENCIFQYTAGIGPNFYIGGIDAHGVRNWIIRNNIFKNISSPSKHIAEHAIHIWDNTENNIIENNIIINSDRGIGFGGFNNSAQKYNYNIKFSNFGGIIRNNVIYHADNGHPYADTGIVIENSPKTVINGNYIFIEHNYPRAIEYRFAQTKGVTIKNNFTNKSISSRNGGEAIVENNNENLSKVDFIIKMNSLMKKMPFH